MSEAKNTLKPETLQLSAAIKKAMDIDTKTGDTVIDSKLFKAHLPDGVTEDIAVSYHNYLNQYAAAAGHAYGEKMIEACAANPELKTGTMEAKLLGRDKLEVRFSHTKQFPNAQDRDNPIVVHGYMDFDLKLAAGNAKSGEIGRARSLIKELSSAKFAG